MIDSLGNHRQSMRHGRRGAKSVTELMSFYTAQNRGANQRGGGGGGFASLSHIVRRWPALPQHERWAMKGKMRLPCQPKFRFPGLLLGLAFLCSVFTCRADTSAPIHDWTVHIGSGAYGVTSWAPGYWNMYWGSRIEPGASVGVQYAAVILRTLLAGIFACSLAAVLLRTVARQQRPNHPRQPTPGISAGCSLRSVNERAPARSLSCPRAAESSALLFPETDVARRISSLDY